MVNEAFLQSRGLPGVLVAFLQSSPAGLECISTCGMLTTLHIATQSALSGDAPGEKHKVNLVRTVGWTLMIVFVVVDHIGAMDRYSTIPFRAFNGPVYLLIFTVIAVSSRAPKHLLLHDHLLTPRDLPDCRSCTSFRATSWPRSLRPRAARGRRRWRNASASS
jgi:hypothetical protein